MSGYERDSIKNPKLYSFQIDEKQLKKAKQQAGRDKISTSNLIRDAIEFYLRLKAVEKEG